MSVATPVPRHPGLFAGGAPGQVPRLHARRCACGHVFHPPHPYGCERCGRPGADTAPVEVPARGVLTAVTAVHAHPKLPVPFLVGRVTVDAGLVVEARLEGPEPPRGARVRGVLVPGGVTEEGASILDLRFERDPTGGP